VPVLAVNWIELRNSVPQLENVLGPEAILRDNPVVVLDVGPPIGPGLRSIVRIVSGNVEFRHCEPQVPLLSEINLSIVDGAIERDKSGRLVAYVHGRSPFRTVNELNRRLNLDRMELSSTDSVLSIRPDSPTRFALQMDVVWPAGTVFPNFTGAGELVLERNLTCLSTTSATGTLAGSHLVGDFSQLYEYQDVPHIGDTLVIRASGRFELVLA
jgi:hypothetical protein